MRNKGGLFVSVGLSEHSFGNGDWMPTGMARSCYEHFMQTRGSMALAVGAGDCDVTRDCHDASMNEFCQWSSSPGIWRHAFNPLSFLSSSSLMF